MRYPCKEGNDYAERCPACETDSRGLGRVGVNNVVNKWRGGLEIPRCGLFMIWERRTGARAEEGVYVRCILRAGAG